MTLSDHNDTEGTLLGLQEHGRPLAALAAPALKYQPLMELGRGGSAVVSAALARGIGGFSKLVVLKTIKEELCAHPDAVRASLNEARLAARMSHPNIVQVYEVYQERGLPVIVMEYLDGLSLSRVARQGQHTPGPQLLRVILSILCKVLEGIRYAHGLRDFDGKPLGIVHRDISPQNVMLTYDGQVKLVDFGTAKLTAGADRLSPLSGMFRGKLGYMPPEQVCGEPIDGRVDLFAVGVMLWEAVAGKRLWGELHQAGIIRRLMEHDIPQLSDEVPGVDPELARICSRALAPLREERYPDATAFLRDLERYLDTVGGSVSALALGQMVQHSCADLKLAREEALRAALAQLEHWQMGSKPDPAATLLPLDSPRDLTLPGSNRPRRRRWLGGAGVLVVCFLTGLLLARPTGRDADPVAPAAPLAATVTLAAPGVTARPPLVVPHGDEPSAAAAAPSSAEPRAVSNAAASNAATTAAVASAEPVALEPGEPALAADARAAQPPRLEKSSQRPRRAATRAPRRPAPRRKAKPASSVAALPARCDPPYVIDAHGIKRFRRDCVGAGTAD